VDVPRTESIVLRQKATGHSLVRRVKDRSYRFLGLFATVLVLIPLFHIIFLVAYHGFSALSLNLLTQTNNGVSGGLANAIDGTLLLVALSLLFSVPIGVLTGVYLGEFGNGRFASIVRVSTDVLTGVPSIVLGYFGYITMVLYLGWDFSALAGGITLAILMLPYIVRTTELAIRNVPVEIKEASLALGITKTTTINSVIIRSAFPGILTGILIGTSIGLGETAPLLYTAGYSNYLPTGNLTKSPVGYLTYVVWSFINEPFASSHALAYAAALILMLMVLATNVFARTIIQIRWSRV
jgi:phosphate transport system permease protein